MAGKRICSVWLIMALLCTGAFWEPALAGQQEAGQDREEMAEGFQGFAPSDPETGREQQGQEGNPETGREQQEQEGNPETGSGQQGQEGNPETGREQQGQEGNPETGGKQLEAGSEKSGASKDGEANQEERADAEAASLGQPKAAVEGFWDSETSKQETPSKDQESYPGRKAAGNVTASGRCGRSLEWSLSEGVLTISGKGAMEDYREGFAPWKKYQAAITRAELQEGVTNIGTYAFAGCTELVTVSMSATVSSIQMRAFWNCTSLQSISLSPALISIWNHAFSGCSSLKEICIPASLRNIGYQAFEGCTGMERFSAEEGSRYYTAKEGVLFGAGMEELIAYPPASLAKSYTVPRQVRKIAAQAFRRCQNLETVTLPEGLGTIEDETFCQCGSLKEAVLPASVTSIGSSAFRECTALKKVTLSSALEEIREYAFSDCRNLADIVIPEGVTSIGDYAFQKCLCLRKVVLPASVASTGLSVFRFCRSLERISIYNKNCQIQDVDDFVHDKTEIYGRKGSTAERYAKKYKRIFVVIGSKAAKKVTISKKKLSLKEGKSVTLKAKVSPSGAAQKVTWISSDPSVASVSAKGKVKAKSDGIVTVMARTGNGKLAACEVTVIGKNRKFYNVIDTASRQNYLTVTETALSGLTATSSGYMSVTAMKQSYSYERKKAFYSKNRYQGILVEYYNKSFRRIKKKKIPMELSKYGGFYAAKDGYYLVFGQDNPKENEDVEVLRIVKYSKKWKRLCAASLRGADTCSIFLSGSLRMTEYGGRLIIRTCHSMYDRGDGIHHQGTLTVAANLSDLKEMIWYDFDVSQSFNQFILADDAGHLVTLDHGDANPRSAVLKEYNARELAAGGYEDLYFSSEQIHTLEYPDYKNRHYNNTGASIGGLSYSKTHYLTAGNSVAHNKKFEKNSTRNIYISVTPRKQPSTASTKVKWITSYKEGGKVSASTPQLVRLSADSFLLLWERIYQKKVGKISYVFLDGKGKKTSKIYNKSGYLSDCQPIAVKGSVVWYAKKSGKTTFYKVGKKGELRTVKVK